MTDTTTLSRHTAPFSLDHRYTAETGTVYMTGIQALVRLLLDQRRRDRSAGLKTAGFVSGYRGSPLGVFDQHLQAASAHLKAHDIVFQPGLNEELAATAVWGSQLAALNDTRTVDGVFGLWYGKGPGVDRSGDALKHGNAVGVSQHGGVLAVAGDDHGAASSTLAHQSDQAFMAAMIPVLAPATVGEILDFGLFGYALSRFSGNWVGLKAQTEVVEGAGVFPIGADRFTFDSLTGFVPPDDGLHIRWPDPPPAMERRLYGPRMDAVRAFADANGLDRLVIGGDGDGEGARLGIVAPGKAALDVLEALRLLGLDPKSAADRGLRLLKPAMVWPLSTRLLPRFASGLETILVIEEKRPIVEDQIARWLLSAGGTAPRLIGKADENGMPLIDTAGVLDPQRLAIAIARRLLTLNPGDGAVQACLDRLAAREGGRSGAKAGPPSRPPYFCAGCPHNTSTKVPEGSRAMAGIGCHGMASWIPGRAIASMTQMGGEGMHWVGQSPFVGETHRFQNMGDGTYAHSGSLNIRAAVAAGTPITFKILYNGAVAMTGGQPVEGGLSVPAIAQQVLADGVADVAVVADDPARYSAINLPRGVTIDHRDDLDQVQRRLREIPGVTVLIYDQVCATEKRRQRKRGKVAEADRRVVINPRVCEGCGDCHAKSGCIAIDPLETPFGRKRRINQSSCNVDQSCVKGFCPSFVTIEGARPRKRTGAKTDAVATFDGTGLPMVPIEPPSSPYSMVVPGIGGTGVVTVAQVLGTAVYRSGHGIRVLDMAGLAQKNGAVVSYLRIAADPLLDMAPRPPAGAADVIIATDSVVAAAPAVRDLIGKDRTHVIVNTDVAPGMGFVFDGAVDLSGRSEMGDLTSAAAETSSIPATALARAAFGDTITANMIMIGFAWQNGLVPISIEALTEAITLNGVAIDTTIAAFHLGRHYAADPQRVSAAFLTPAGENPLAKEEDETPQAVIDCLAADLAAYQDGAYADRFKAALAPLIEAVQRVNPQTTGLMTTAAKALHKLMAYKDEYEVARLHLDADFQRQMDEEFDGGGRVTYYLAPPLIAPRDPETGEPRKLAFGPWVRHVFKALVRMRGLRGRWLDPFGRTAERRTERALIDEYERILADMGARLTRENGAAILSILALPLEIRGYGHIKDRAVQRYRHQLDEKRAALAHADLERARSPTRSLNRDPIDSLPPNG